MAIVKDLDLQSQSEIPCRRETTTRAICLAIALSICLLVIRGYTMGIRIGSAASPLHLMGQLISGAKYDLLVVFVLLAFCLLSLRYLGRNPTARRWISVCYTALVVTCLVVSITNITVVKFLGGPLNYEWFYYSDFGTGVDLRNALSALATWDVLMRIPMGILSLLVITKLLASIAARLQSTPWAIKSALVAITVALGVATYNGRSYWNAYSADQGDIANPVIHFVQSLVTKDEAPLLTMPTPVSTDDFSIVAERSPPPPSDHPFMLAGIRNVMVFVFESVAAQYLETYGGEFPVTPNIASRAGHSIRFDNIYAHAPNSTKALVALMTSTYPLISYKTVTKETPQTRFSSMSTDMQKHGYRTGFFYSSDLRYQHVDRFLRLHSFDVVKDFRSIECDKEAEIAWREETYEKHTADDRCTASSAGDWMLSDDDRPFFAVVWTDMTHLPYFAPKAEQIYVQQDQDLNRYLNALRIGDQALGSLLDRLQNAGRLDSTLVVILGDHGEAFGQHDQRSHGANLYEENVHIPLILFNPTLGQSGTSSVVGGLIDIAPTIFDVLGLDLPQSWQGRSLFAPDRPPRTYFFATWTHLQFGYREADTKRIFDATLNRCKSFNLSDDPGETGADQRGDTDECRMIQERLAAWIQYQSHLMRELAGGP